MMTTEMILTVLVGMFAFLALSATLRLRKARIALLKGSNELYDTKKDLKYWENSWEHLWRQYKRLSTIDASDTDPPIIGDTGFQSWDVEGADSTPQPDSWQVLTP